jgi:hypothetical protein
MNKISKTNNNFFKVGILATSACSLMGAVYIAPPDIDSYKQKTDQNFYDMYQNPDSAIAKGANPILKKFTNNISTKNKMAYGSTITKTVQGAVQGTMIKAGTQTVYNIPGLGKYVFTVDPMGNVKIYGAYTTPNHTAVIREGINAQPVGGVWCSRSTSVSFGKGSATKCLTYRRNAIEKNFDLITGKYIQRVVTQQTNAIGSCYSTGKDSGRCNMRPNYRGFRTVAVNNILTQSISVADILKHNQLYALKAIRGKDIAYLRGALDHPQEQYQQKTGKGN